ncbi:STAS domain-containing protein [Streptomyces sp. NPDC058611]|uniref:STAS domain-containing protein n=1 Tax=unclassified Streptomyces TaxID=2593676 RepID=UPI003649E422
MIGDRDETVARETTPDGITVVRVHGDLDNDTTPALTRALSAAAHSSCPRTVVDLSEVEFADSSALHAFLAAQRAHTTAGTALVLAGPLQTAVRRLFEVTNTAPAFRWADTVQQAMTF